MSRQDYARVDITTFQAPRPRGPVVTIVVGALVLVAVVLWGVFGSGFNRPVTDGPSASPSPSATTAGPGMPFTMPSSSDSRGRWEILDEQWDSDGVAVLVRLYADAGVISYGFAAFENNGTNPVDPISGLRQPELASGSLRAGQAISGFVYLPIPRAPATLVLTTAGGRPVSALPIQP